VSSCQLFLSVLHHLHFRRMYQGPDAPRRIRPVMRLRRRALPPSPLPCRPPGAAPAAVPAAPLPPPGAAPAESPPNLPRDPRRIRS
jgi:hypothetical protein